MFLLSLLRECFYVVEIGCVPSITNVMDVFVMTTADRLVPCVLYTWRLPVVVLFRFRLWNKRERSMFGTSHFRLNVQVGEKKKAQTLYHFPSGCTATAQKKNKHVHGIVDTYFRI